MTTAGSTLFWTVDSPFSRIVLWALCENEDNHVKPVHLSWAELNNNQTIESKLGPERTVPCLTDNSSLPTSDSLRILATFQKATFADWLMSRDGALYRCCEGQWGRVMYALYDGLEPKKVRQLWLIAVEAAEHLVDLTEENPEKIAKVSLGNIALHTFASFCVGLKPEWRSDLSPSLTGFLASLEQTASFLKLRAQLETQAHLIRCDAFSRSAAGAGSSIEAAR